MVVIQILVNGNTVRLKLSKEQYKVLLQGNLIK